MYFKCCIANCGSKREDSPLHRFPINEDQRMKWINAINCDSLRSVDPSNLSKLLVCHKHFEKRFHSGSTRIKTAAYPTLFTMAEIKSGISRKLHEQENYPSEDHTYACKRHYDHTYHKPAKFQKLHDSSLENKKLTDITNLASTSASEANTLNYIKIAPDINNQSTLLPTLELSQIEEVKKPDFITAHTPVLTSSSGLENTQIISDSSTSAAVTSTPKTSQLETKKSTAKPSLAPKTVRRKRQRKRIIQKYTELTPKCKILYEQYKKSKRQQNFKERAKRALTFSKENDFDKITKNMNAISKQFFWMQINLCTKNKKGWRFTLDEKLIALSIMKQSPKAYRFLQKNFILPSATTLKKVTTELDLKPGINSQLFKVIENEVKNWDEKKRLCTIMFDEMALETGLVYSKKDDSINGFVNLNEKTDNIADHALVFLIRGAVYKWQQPVAYYFTEGAVQSHKLQIILKDVILATMKTGLIPIALVCDQGSSFQSALRNMQEKTRGDQLREGIETDDTVYINGISLSIIFDPPHLIKGIRNNFLTKNIKMDGKISKWDDILEVYKTDCKHMDSRMMPKLQDDHVIPEKVRKMKVKNCVRALSKSVAAALNYTSEFSYYSDGRPVSKTMANTAETVSFYDDLFDSVNGVTRDHKKCGGKVLRKTVTKDSPHHVFWREAVKKIEETKFIDSRGGEKSVPSLKNWVTTLNSYQRVWQVLNSKNVEVMRPRYMNSDPIENFFGRVRAYNFRNNDPTCHTFVSTFKSLIITGFIKFHSDSYNCEDDSCNQLIRVKSLFKKNEVNKSVGNDTLEDNIEYDAETKEKDLHFENLQVQAARERLSIHSKAYTVGWVIKKIFLKVKCADCKNRFCTNECSETHRFISKKEYATLKAKKLTYPTENAVRSFGYIIKETNGYLEYNAHKQNITKEIKNCLKNKYPFNFPECENEGCLIPELFINISIRLMVFNWCNIINRILKGTDLLRLDKLELPPMQNKALIKYKKKLKNKSFNK